MMTRRRRLLALCLTASLPITHAAQAAPGNGSGGTPALGLVGLWEARRDFGPEVDGTLDLLQRGRSWSARIAGFQAPALVAGPRKPLTHVLGQRRGALAVECGKRRRP